MPTRVQRKRTKGWRMPANTISVTRPGKWGNPFGTAAEFRCWVERLIDGHPAPALDDMRAQQVALMVKNIDQLKGKNLACFCSLDKPCHADVLLEIANERNW